MKRQGSNHFQVNDRERWLRQRNERARERERERKKKEWTFIGMVVGLVLLFIFVPKWLRTDRSKPDQFDQEAQNEGLLPSSQELASEQKSRPLFLEKAKRGAKMLK